ncbi:hypothetical protein LLS1_03730 [Leifsonia sp. LS1]|uniref:hypothetical protein n=1 Tax=unclassified Leifsonia TaxID=2663824 RepID=UPI001CBE6F7D|nr:MULTISPECIES: hypothetical protein [unclassified Leifsonia]UAJ79302.1 hypothetical protein IT072_19240 [Leifsonia sp. ZF2019]GIT78704.1 hypothetical protein LLS1_03730 [Leifsonia sp. LS1]
MTNIKAPNVTDDVEVGSALDFHAEVYTSTTTHDPIRVGCWCPIGRTHTYEEAVAA